VGEGLAGFGDGLTGVCEGLVGLGEGLAKPVVVGALVGGWPVVAWGMGLPVEAWVRGLACCWACTGRADRSGREGTCDHKHRSCACPAKQRHITHVRLYSASFRYPTSSIEGLQPRLRCPLENTESHHHQGLVVEGVSLGIRTASVNPARCCVHATPAAVSMLLKKPSCGLAPRTFIQGNV
jgi:hypothetical protein